jgi:hypothetical protein
MDYQFRPIETWPGEFTARRKRAQFRASFTQTQRLLDCELRQLGATNIVIQAAVRPSDIRLDGMLRADARSAVHPGIILSFDSKHGPLVYPCDRFDNWQDNLRAIALSLEHLRAVDRFGVTKRGEQYRGWERLPPPGGGAGYSDMSREEALQVLARMAGYKTVRDEPAAVQDAYRRAAMAAHPDHGGTAEAFKVLQQAMEVLKR